MTHYERTVGKMDIAECRKVLGVLETTTIQTDYTLSNKDKLQWARRIVEGRVRELLWARSK